jgi:hypothetical protein
MTDPMLDRQVRRRLAILRHADEMTGNVAMIADGWIGPLVYRPGLREVLR